MNLAKLVEDGAYTKDMLNENDKRFIEGMEYVLKIVYIADSYED